MNTLRILIADDHILIRAGIRILLENIEGIQVVAEASTGHEVLELVTLHQPDIHLTDIGMPELNGLEAIRQLTQHSNAMRIIVLSMHLDEDHVWQALMAGAHGYIVKAAVPTELEQAILTVMRGDKYLSPFLPKSVLHYLDKEQPLPTTFVKELTTRQQEVLRFIAQGQTTKDIAQHLNLSLKTIETHRTDLMNRLDIHDVAGLVRYAVRRGVVSTDT